MASGKVHSRFLFFGELNGQSIGQRTLAPRDATRDARAALAPESCGQTQPVAVTCIGEALSGRCLFLWSTPPFFRSRPFVSIPSGTIRGRFLPPQTGKLRVTPDVEREYGIAHSRGVLPWCFDWGFPDGIKARASRASLLPAS